MPSRIAALALSLALALPALAAAPRASRHAARPAAERSPELSLSQLLARTFRAYGGVEAILAVEGVHLRGTIQEGSAGPANPARLERVLGPPDRYRAAVSLGGMERETLVLQGGRAFRDGAEVTGLARADQIRLEAARAFLPAALARGRESLVDRGGARRGGRRLRLIELPLHDQASLTAEIDESTGRIVRAVSRVAGKEIAVSFRRFRAVDGILFPFAEDVEASDGKRTLVVDTVELVPARQIAIQAP